MLHDTIEFYNYIYLIKYINVKNQINLYYIYNWNLIGEFR